PSLTLTFTTTVSPWLNFGSSRVIWADSNSATMDLFSLLMVTDSLFGWACLVTARTDAVAGLRCAIVVMGSLASAPDQACRAQEPGIVPGLAAAWLVAAAARFCRPASGGGGVAQLLQPLLQKPAVNLGQFPPLQQVRAPLPGADQGLLPAPRRDRGMVARAQHRRHRAVGVLDRMAVMRAVQQAVLEAVLLRR